MTAVMYTATEFDDSDACPEKSYLCTHWRADVEQAAQRACIDYALAVVRKTLFGDHHLGGTTSYLVQPDDTVVKRMMALLAELQQQRAALGEVQNEW